MVGGVPWTGGTKQAPVTKRRNKCHKDLSHTEHGQFTFIGGTSNCHLLYNRDPQYNEVSFPGSLGVGPGSKKPVGGTVMLNLCPGTQEPVTA